MKNKKIVSTLIMSVIIFSLYALNTLLISPLISDIVLRSSIPNAHILEILLYLSGLLPVIATFIGYAFIIRGTLSSSVKDTLPQMIGYQAVCFVSLAFSVIMRYVSAGALPSNEEFSYNMLTLLLNFILVAAMMYAVVYVSFLIKKRGESPARIIIASTLAAALLEAIKQLVIELSYIIPFLAEYGTDITTDEIFSMCISILWAAFVFGAGYAVERITLKILNNKKTAV